MSTREQLIANGVRNLKKFGYPSVTPENILTTPIYVAFFKPMLEEWAEERRDIRRQCNMLLIEIAESSPSKEPE